MGRETDFKKAPVHVYQDLQFSMVIRARISSFVYPPGGSRSDVDRGGGCRPRHGRVAARARTGKDHFLGRYLALSSFWTSDWQIRATSDNASSASASASSAGASPANKLDALQNVLKLNLQYQSFLREQLEAIDNALRANSEKQVPPPACYTGMFNV